MPVYDYECEACGPFRVMRPMSESSEPYACPDCQRDAPRQITACNFSSLSRQTRLAHATNERSAHAPKRSTGAHGAGCACCSAKPSRDLRTAADGAKSFPRKRPWMISH
jgi:putative FmdB family regulatory protein